MLDYLEKFKAVTLAVSVDGLGARNDYIRFGSDFDEVIANIKTAREMPGINVVRQLRDRHAQTRATSMTSPSFSMVWDSRRSSTCAWSPGRRFCRPVTYPTR